jgi:uncharacterized membrane protein YbhN (UPF0104 family)
MSIQALESRLNQALHRREVQVLLGSIVTIVSLASLGYILIKNWDTLSTYQWRIDYRPIAVSFAVYSLDLFVVVWGWTLIIGRLAGAWDFRTNLKYYCYSGVVRRIPGGPWDIVGRVYLYERTGVRKLVTSAAGILEWWLIVLSGVLTYLVSLGAGSPASLRNVLAIVALFLLGMILVQPSLIARVLNRLGHHDAGFGSVPFLYIVTWLLLYGVVWLIGGATLYCVIRSLHDLPLQAFPGLVGAWALSGVVAFLGNISPGGLGVKEVTLTLLLQSYMPASLAVVIAVLMRLITTLYELIWGAIALRL